MESLTGMLEVHPQLTTHREKTQKRFDCGTSIVNADDNSEIGYSIFDCFKQVEDTVLPRPSDSDSQPAMLMPSGAFGEFVQEVLVWPDD